MRQWPRAAGALAGQRSCPASQPRALFIGPLGHGGNVSNGSLVSSTSADRRLPSAWLAAFAGTLALLSGLFSFLVFNDLFHDLEHRRLGTEARLELVRPAQLVDELQAYFVSPEQSLLGYPYLSRRERLHYLEVKNVIRVTLAGFLVSTVVTLASLAWILAHGRRRGTPLRWIARKVLGNMAWMLLTTIAAGVLLALNFDRSFLVLHHLLFEGQNWMVPTHSLTARVFPGQYFFDFFLVYGGLVIAAAVAILVTLAAPALRTTDRASPSGRSSG